MLRIFGRGLQEPEIQDDFAHNPEPRCPCVLILDVSWSMTGKRIKRLNDAVSSFSAQIREDPLIASRADVAVVTFNAATKVPRNFTTALDFDPPHLSTGAGTNFCPAINRALDMVEDRKASYREHGIEYFRPILLMITDGEPQGDTEQEIQATAQRIMLAEENRQAAFFAFGIDRMASINTLARFTSPNRPPLQIDSASLTGLFTWLSASVATSATSQPGTTVRLPDLNAFLQV